MDQESMKRLRLDRRLQRRRGWIDDQRLQEEIASLPDVADKIDDRPEPEPAEAPAPAEPAPPAPETTGY